MIFSVKKKFFLQLELFWKILNLSFEVLITRVIVWLRALRSFLVCSLVLINGWFQVLNLKLVTVLHFFLLPIINVLNSLDLLLMNSIQSSPFFFNHRVCFFYESFSRFLTNAYLLIQTLLQIIQLFLVSLFQLSNFLFVVVWIHWSWLFLCNGWIQRKFRWFNKFCMRLFKTVAGWIGKMGTWLYWPECVVIDDANIFLFLIEKMWVLFVNHYRLTYLHLTDICLLVFRAVNFHDWWLVVSLRKVELTDVDIIFCCRYLSNHRQVCIKLFFTLAINRTSSTNVHRSSRLERFFNQAQTQSVRWV